MADEVHEKDKEACACETCTQEPYKLIYCFKNMSGEQRLLWAWKLQILLCPNTRSRGVAFVCCVLLDEVYMGLRLRSLWSMLPNLLKAPQGIQHSEELLTHEILKEVRWAQNQIAWLQFARQFWPVCTLWSIGDHSKFLLYLCLKTCS